MIGSPWSGSRQILEHAWLGVLCGALAACSPAPPAALIDVGQPQELAQLDATVRDQFDELWKTLHDRQLNGKQLGSAWGRMGQWFDVYHYEVSAEQSYANARLLDPEEGRWPYYQGLIALQQGDTDLAGKRFNLAAELAPEMPAPHVQLGDMALAMAQLGAAETSYLQAMSLDANNAGALYGLSQVALARGNPEVARDALEQLLKLQPEASQVHYSLALVWRQLGDHKRAGDHMAKVPETNSDQIGLGVDDPWITELKAFDQGAVALTRRAVRASNRGERGMAVALFASAVVADPEGPDKRVNYAKSLIAVGQTGAAIEQLQEALKLSQHQPESASRAHVALGALYSTQKKMALAETHLRAALEYDPASTEVHVHLARIRQYQGQYDGALTEYAILRDMVGTNAEFCFWHAALLIILERRSEARQAIEEDLARVGDDARLRQLLARVLATSADAMSSDPARAWQLLDGEEKPDAFYAETAAMVAAAEGRFADAAAWQQAAIAVLDDNQTRSAAHIARRRLVLYEQQQACGNPWETTERVVSRRLISQPTTTRGNE